jgi:hypothetical protein
MCIVIMHIECSVLCGTGVWNEGGNSRLDRMKKITIHEGRLGEDCYKLRTLLSAHFVFQRFKVSSIAAQAGKQLLHNSEAYTTELCPAERHRL